VRYSAAALRAVLARDSGISTAERVETLRDAAALVASGDVTAPEALALVPDSATADERHVVEAGALLRTLSRESAMNDREAAQLARFLRKTYGARAAKLGLVRRPNDGADGELLRPKLFWLAAYRGEDASLRKKAHDLAFAWLKDPLFVAPELVEGVLAAAATTNDAHLFDAIIDRAKVDTDRTRLLLLLTALGRFTSPDLAKRADDLVAGTAFDIRDTIFILRAQFYARATQQIAWDFEKTSFDALAARLRSDDMNYDLVDPINALCDEAHRAEAKAFFDARAQKYDGLAHSSAIVEEGVGQCAATFEKNRAGLDAFLAKY
jgi:alanyl aminopeptidase